MGVGENEGVVELLVAGGYFVVVVAAAAGGGTVQKAPEINEH